MIVLVAAVGSNRVIGADGSLPWSLPEDLKRFRRITMGNPVIMGRRTFESIGRPLDGRTNIVLTRDESFQFPGVVTTHTPAAALRAAADAPGDAICVIGGGQIYAEFLPLADRLELTAVAAAPPGDAHFPEWESGEWREVAAEAHAGPPPFTFTTLERVS